MTFAIVVGATDATGCIVGLVIGTREGIVANGAKLGTTNTGSALGRPCGLGDGWGELILVGSADGAVV